MAEKWDSSQFLYGFFSVPNLINIILLYLKPDRNSILYLTIEKNVDIFLFQIGY